MADPRPFKLFPRALCALAALVLTGLTLSADTPAAPAWSPGTADDKTLVAMFQQAMESRATDRTTEILSLVTDDNEPAVRWAGFPLDLPGPKALQALEGQLQATRAQRNAARKALVRVLAYVAEYRALPEPRTADIPHRVGAITIDARLDEPTWAHAALLDMDVAYPNLFANPSTQGTARLLWDETHLYLGFDIQDATPKATHLERDSNVYDDDCVELFFQFSHDPIGYWELNISRKNVVRDVRIVKPGPGRWSGNKDLAASLDGMQHAAREIHNDAGEPVGYVVEVAVPWAALFGDDRKVKANDRFPFVVGYSDILPEPGDKRPQTYYSNIITWVGYHDTFRYATLTLRDTPAKPADTAR